MKRCKICNTAVEYGEQCLMCQVDEIRNYAEGYQGRNGLNKYLQEMKRISRRDELQEALPALFLTGQDGLKVSGPK